MTENKLLEEIIKIIKIIKTTPNDIVLGEKVRKLYNQFINSEK
jgi:hypothetical protein